MRILARQRTRRLVRRCSLGASQGAPRGTGGRLGAGRGAAARLVTLVKELREALELSQALVGELGEATRLEQRDGGGPTARGLGRSFGRRWRASSRSSGRQRRRASSRGSGAGGGPRAGGPAPAEDLEQEIRRGLRSVPRSSREIAGRCGNHGEVGSRVGVEITGRWDRGQVQRSRRAGIMRAGSQKGKGESGDHDDVNTGLLAI